jgi:hypothetical protein
MIARVPTASAIARAIALAAAVVVAAWFAVGIRQAQGTDQAAAILSSPGPLTSAQEHHVSTLLRGASLLNPDREVDLLKSQLALKEDNVSQARRIALSVTMLEPQNAEAWLDVIDTATSDESTFFLVLRRLHELVPPIPARR